MSTGPVRPVEGEDHDDFGGPDPVSLGREGPVTSPPCLFGHHVTDGDDVDSAQVRRCVATWLTRGGH